MLDNWGYQHIICADLLSSVRAPCGWRVVSRVTNTAYQIESSSCKWSSLPQVALENKSGLCHTKLIWLRSWRTLPQSNGETGFENIQGCTQANFQPGAWKNGHDCSTPIWWQSCSSHLCKRNATAKRSLHAELGHQSLSVYCMALDQRPRSCYWGWHKKKHTVALRIYPISPSHLLALPIFSSLQQAYLQFPRALTHSYLV